ncbi:M48 family metallopeptidase [Endothiovibrio diazotrophicus]
MNTQRISTVLRRATRAAVALPLLFLAPALPAAAPNAIALPDMGDSAGAVLSREEERKLGEAFMREARRQLTLIEDGEINAYLGSLGNRLTSHSDGDGRPFTFFVVSDPTINAFAAPGGFIGVHSGLILATRNESELAAVLAHEIAHVTQHHIARSVAASGKMSIAYQAALIAAILLATRDSQLGQAAVAATQAGIVQSQINFTRDNEYEADRVGMRTLARAGFDPEGMPDFFERLAQAYRFQKQPPEFLSTHPVTTTRISESRARADQLPRPAPQSRLNYRMMRAKLEVLEAKEDRKLLDSFEKRLAEKTYDSEVATRYGYALALTRAGRYDAARRELKALLKQEPDRTPLINALAVVERESGHTERALRIFDDALLLYPGDYALSLEKANTLLAADRPLEARQVLLPLVDDHDGPALRRTLATAAERAGRHAEAHRQMAEFHYQNGDLDNAIQQLETALKLGDDDYFENARASARLKEFKDEFREMKERKEKER